jgi:hypothetical protein
MTIFGPGRHAMLGGAKIGYFFTNQLVKGLTAIKIFSCWPPGLGTYYAG